MLGPPRRRKKPPQALVSPAVRIARDHVGAAGVADSPAFQETPEEEVSISIVQMRRLYRAKCLDQDLPIKATRERRFMELIHKSCSGLRFSLIEHGLGENSARALVSVLRQNRSYSILELCGNQFRDDGTVLLADLFRYNDTIVRADLRSNDIGSHGAEALFEALVDNVTLTSLDLSGLSGINRNHIGLRGAAALSVLLQRNPVLYELNLASNGLGVEGIRYLCDGLKDNPVLERLNISSNNIGPRGCEYLTQVLDSPVTLLSHLILERNGIGDRGVTLLSSALKNTDSSHLRYLDLSYNRITRVGAAALCEMLKMDEVLRTVRLDGNEFGNEGAEQVASMLEGHKHLVLLSLAKNEIENEGCAAIGRALESNEKLEQLDLSSNYVDSGVIQLCKCLCGNRSLLSLDLSNNRIDDEGGNAIAVLVRRNRVLRKLCIKQNDMKSSGRRIADALKANLSITTLQFAYNNFSYTSYSTIRTFLKRNRARNKIGEKARLLDKIQTVAFKEQALQEQIQMNAEREDEYQADQIQIEELTVEKAALRDRFKTENLRLSQLLEDTSAQRKVVEANHDRVAARLQRQIKESATANQRADVKLQQETDRVAELGSRIFDIQKKLNEVRSNFEAENAGLLKLVADRKEVLLTDENVLAGRKKTMQEWEEKVAVMKRMLAEHNRERKEQARRRRRGGRRGRRGGGRRRGRRRN